MPSRRPDLDERFYKARDAFSAPRFKALYRVWKQDGESAFAASRSHVLDDAVTAGAGRVETLELGHRYGHLSPPGCCRMRPNSRLFRRLAAVDVFASRRYTVGGIIPP